MMAPVRIPLLLIRPAIVGPLMTMTSTGTPGAQGAFESEDTESTIPRGRTAIVPEARGRK